MSQQQKQLSDYTANELLVATLAKVREGNVTREQSIVITKLQEAQMWHKEHETSLLNSARRSGVGFNGNVQSPQPPRPVVPGVDTSGITMTEPLDPTT